MAEKHGSLSINSENIFPIIKKWLYSDHDIFARELISNGCDAITKLKKLDIMGEYTLPDDYKADLRLVFPFCIPFDLVHLIQAFEAEAQAPVFEFPLDLELENPWTGEKILDYHHTFELDMSDYEPVIKIFRIFEIIFFIIGLLMITRQHMIKG